MGAGPPVGPYRLDLAFPDRKLAVEVDGWAFHSDVDRFVDDRRRGNALTLAGWTVLHVTWHDLHHRPAPFLATLRAHLARDDQSA